MQLREKNNHFSMIEKSKNENLNLLLERLHKSKIDFNSSEDSNNVINNPNYFFLLENFIHAIDFNKLEKKEEKDFFFDLLLNIHNRIFSASKLWYLNSIKEIPKEKIEKFLNKIEIKLKNYWEKYYLLLKTLDNVISNVKLSYEDVLSSNANSNEILSSLIIESLSKLENLDFSLLSKENLNFINSLSENIKIKLTNINKNINISDSLNLIILKKLNDIERILSLSDIKPKVIYSEENDTLLNDTLSDLFLHFSKLLKTSYDSLILDNSFTESLLTNLERLSNLNNLSNDLKENICYILINIIDSRKYAIISDKISNKDYDNIELNKRFADRWESLYHSLSFKSNK